MKQGWALAVLLGACAAETPDTAGTATEDELGEQPEAAHGDSANAGAAERGAPGAGAQSAASEEMAARAPSELQCVSDASQQAGEAHPSVWRVALYNAGESASVTLTRGPLFVSHAGVWSDAAAGSARVEPLVSEGPLRFAAEADAQVAIDLAQRGLFFHGELVIGDITTEVVCWDRIRLFGSSWSSQPSALAAHYDPALGRCVDAEGAPAHNVLPLEFVLEANYGECADLRGARINRDDYGQPDISLNLRGANLEGATLHFANLSGSFEGARLGLFDFGYARVSGSLDAFTELPQNESCSIMDSPWSGLRMSCVR